MSNWSLPHRRARNWDSKSVNCQFRCRCRCSGTGCEWLRIRRLRLESGEVGGEACLECHQLIHSGTAGVVGSPADRPSSLAVGASGLAVGWQWVRPANQRITGVGERCSSPLALGPQRPGCGTRRIYTELSRILDVASQCVYEHFTLHIVDSTACLWMHRGQWEAANGCICSLYGSCGGEIA